MVTFVKYGGGVTPGSNSIHINCCRSAGANAFWNSFGSASAMTLTLAILPGSLLPPAGANGDGVALGVSALAPLPPRGGRRCHRQHRRGGGGARPETMPQ